MRKENRMLIKKRKILHQKASYSFFFLLILFKKVAVKKATQKDPAGMKIYNQSCEVGIDFF